MIRDSTKKKIKQKFGTITKFCKAAKLDRYTFQKDYLSAKKIDSATEAKLNKLIASTKPEPTELTDKMRKKIKLEIERLGGLDKFCADHGFKKITVYQIVNGDYYKGVSKQVLRLLETLWL